MFFRLSLPGIGCLWLLATAAGCAPQSDLLGPIDNGPKVPEGPTQPPAPQPPAPPPVPVPPAPAPTGQFAVSYGKWAPSGNDTCSKETHDSYRVVGPDGKWYPTWHPPVDPVSGCTFGHEHGRDPAGSAIFNQIEPIAFGYANEVLMDAGAPTAVRHEDHAGHKIEWINDVQVGDGLGGTMQCSVLLKLHQGTHSKDAFANNVHELFYHAACSNGLAVHARVLSPIGPAGEFTESCELSNRIGAGNPTPFDSPNGAGDSRRRIPTPECYDEGGLAEQWSTFTVLSKADGSFLADFNPYMITANPSRVFQPAIEGLVGRPIDQCQAGQVPAALSAVCRELTPGVAWDDPASPFRGDRRMVKFNRLTANGSEEGIWYTDAYGKHASTTPFGNSIRQIVRGTTAAHASGRIQYLSARNGDFNAQGVHAPN